MAGGAGCRLGDWLGDVENPNRSRDVVRINLSKCFPEMDPAERERLVGQSLKDIGKSLTESACAWIWPAQRSIDLVREVEGLDVLKDALASGKGVVGITSHLGNWEVLNHFYCNQCKPIIFYRPPKLKAVDGVAQAAGTTGQQSGRFHQGRHPQRHQGSAQRWCSGHSRRPGTGRSPPGSSCRSSPLRH